MPQKYVFEYGLTLIELMIVVILIGIGAALTAPNFASIIRDNRMSSQANQLLSSLQLARSEAATQSVQVTIRRTSSQNQVWEEGWQVFTDWNADGQFDGDADVTDCSVEQDCLLRVEDGLQDGTTLRSGSNYAVWMGFLPSGLPTSGAGLGTNTFQLCPANGKKEDGRSVIVNNTGRPAVEKEADSCP